jgi:hypothetical protein
MYSSCPSLMEIAFSGTSLRFTYVGRTMAAKKALNAKQIERGLTITPPLDFNFAVP